MAKTVEEIMNREVFSLRPEESAEQALDCILTLGISGAPVLDRDRRVVGYASFRDLLARMKGPLVAHCMTTPVEVVSRGTTIDEAARRMVRLGVHHLVVTDETRAVGVASVLDAMSALLGIPVVHGPTFPDFDRATGIAWSSESELTLDAASRAPDAPGLFVLIQGAPLQPDWIMWIEATLNLRTRLAHLLCAPQKSALLTQLLASSVNLRFRAAAVANDGDRQRALAKLKEAAQRWPASAFTCETEQRVAEPQAHVGS